MLFYKVYRRQAGQSGLALWKRAEVHKLEIDQIDVFANYTVGISYVNSANKESAISTASFLGSKFFTLPIYLT